MATGRFAPSPTGTLHLGNLRTALLAWLFARSSGGRFLLRFEDLDQVASRAQHEAEQRHDLASLGLDWDWEERQSDHPDRYAAAIDHLTAAGLTYPCYCTRREVREAAAAPHGPTTEGAYPGTCRHLTPAEREERVAAGRRAALRLRTDGETVTFRDRLHGEVAGVVDDLVLRRTDGVAAYNLAVVVDDARAGIEEVVRGDDLLHTTPRQVHLARLLDLAVPAYAHVPLVLGAAGARLAKRDGAVTLADRIGLGETAADVVGLLAHSLGLVARREPVTPTDLVTRFDPGRLPRDPWVFHDVAP